MDVGTGGDASFRREGGRTDTLNFNELTPEKKWSQSPLCPDTHLRKQLAYGERPSIRPFTLVFEKQPVPGHLTHPFFNLKASSFPQPHLIHIPAHTLVINSKESAKGGHVHFSSGTKSPTWPTTSGLEVVRDSDLLPLTELPWPKQNWNPRESGAWHFLYLLCAMPRPSSHCNSLGRWVLLCILPFGDLGGMLQMTSG